MGLPREELDHVKQIGDDADALIAAIRSFNRKLAQVHKKIGRSLDKLKQIVEEEQ